MFLLLNIKKQNKKKQNTNNIKTKKKKKKTKPRDCTWKILYVKQLCPNALPWKALMSSSVKQNDRRGLERVRLARFQ